MEDSLTIKDSTITSSTKNDDGVSDPKMVFSAEVMNANRKRGRPKFTTHDLLLTGSTSVTEEEPESQSRDNKRVAHINKSGVKSSDINETRVSEDAQVSDDVSILISESAASVPALAIQKVQNIGRSSTLFRGPRAVSAKLKVSKSLDNLQKIAPRTG